MARINKAGLGAIGMLDSGMGGLSLLADAVVKNPGDRYLYVADTAYAPYGEKSRDIVTARVMEVAARMSAIGIRLLVLACNTATSAAGVTLRQQMPMPVVGMEPALKPAVEGKETQTILVAATPLTLREDKFLQLMAHWRGSHHVTLLPCPGLVDVIEREGPEALAVDQTLKALTAPYEGRPFTRLVLGCTHYVLIRHQWQQLMGDKVQLIDGNQGTLRQIMRLLGEDQDHPSDKDTDKTSITITSSAKDPATTNRLKDVFIDQLYRRGLSMEEIASQMEIITEEECL